MTGPRALPDAEAPRTLPGADARALPGADACALPGAEMRALPVVRAVVALPGSDAALEPAAAPAAARTEKTDARSIAERALATCDDVTREPAAED